MTSIKTLFLLISLVFGINTVNAQDIQECSDTDFRALVTLYLSTEGWNWDTKWDLNQAPSTWHGVTLNQDGCVTGLSLTNNNLKGEIPTTLCNLVNLRTLNLTDNQLSGSIPECIDNLSQLTLLDLSMNTLTGPIPTTIGQLTNLRTLSLFQNKLDGFIPHTIGDLSNLFTLNLQGNQLVGAIPESLGSLSSLFVLSLENNDLIGSIPNTIGNLTRLFFIDLGSNNLTGPIPAAISNMENLFNLELDNNQLSGEIPEEIMGLSNLQSLWLANNQLTGTIPEDLTKMTNLEWLALNNNQLTGSLPDSISALEKITLLFLDNNQLSGTLPLAIPEFANLMELTLNNNSFTGCFPESYKNLCGIRYNFSENPGLPNNGDFDAFCESSAGSCELEIEPEEFICGLQFSLVGEEEECFAVRNLTINIEEGVSPFRIEIDGPIRGGLTTAIQNLPILGVPAGTYVVSITDAEGCSIIKELTIATSCLDGKVDRSRSKAPTTVLPLTDFLPATTKSLSAARNYPNPFYSSTTLPFTLSHRSDVNITVTTATGQRIFKLQDNYEAGRQEVIFNSGIFKDAGIYIYQIQSGETVVSGKMIRL